MAQNNNM